MTNIVFKLATVLALVFSSCSASAASLPDGLSGFELGMKADQARALVDKMVAGKDPRYECIEASELHPGAIQCDTDLPGVDYYGTSVKGASLVFIDKELTFIGLFLDEETAAGRDKSASRILEGLEQYLPADKPGKTKPRLSGDWIFADGTWLSISTAEDHLMAVMLGNDRAWTLLKAYDQKTRGPAGSP